jgi:hypothetical protein
MPEARLTNSVALWSPNRNPVITVDLGARSACASFGMNFHGNPWHDAFTGNQLESEAAGF